MYLFTVFDASKPIPGLNYKNKYSAQGDGTALARSQIEHFKHKDYVRMYNNGAFTDVVNCRIGSELHQLRLIIFI